MADENTPQNGAVDPNAQQFVPQLVYLKDVSFESPLGPRLPAQAENPTINMNLNSSFSQIGEDLYEVVLSVEVRSVVAEKTTVWLCEVQQAGAFMARNLSQPELHQVMGTFCPNYLLAYARAVVSDLLVKGGFPPFLLPPVNFDHLYAQASAQNQQNAAAANQPTVN